MRIVAADMEIAAVPKRTDGAVMDADDASMRVVRRSMDIVGREMLVDHRSAPVARASMRIDRLVTPSAGVSAAVARPSMRILQPAIPENFPRLGTRERALQNAAAAMHFAAL